MAVTGRNQNASGSDPACLLGCTSIRILREHGVALIIFFGLGSQMLHLVLLILCQNWMGGTGIIVNFLGIRGINFKKKHNPLCPTPPPPTCPIIIVNLDTFDVAQMFFLHVVFKLMNL